MLKISGINLKEAFSNAGIKQEEAALKLGVSRQTVSNWFGKANLGTDIINLVKTKLDLDLTKYALPVEEESGKDEIIRLLRDQVQELKADKERLLKRLDELESK